MHAARCRSPVEEKTGTVANLKAKITSFLFLRNLSIVLLDCAMGNEQVGPLNYDKDRDRRKRVGRV